MSTKININSVVISGNVVKDAEVKQVGQTNVISFTVAVNDYAKGNDGSSSSYVNYLDVSYFCKNASFAQYLGKGKPVVVSGSIRQQRWEKDGQKHSRVGIHANQVELGGSGSGNGSGTSGQSASGSATSDNGGFSEDIPF